MSGDYALTHQTDNALEASLLEGRPYAAGHGTGVPIIVTTENPVKSDSATCFNEDTAQTAIPLTHTSPPKRTLQIRHSDSFDGSSYTDSSEDSEDEHVPRDKGSQHRSGLTYDHSGQYVDQGNGLGVLSRLEEADTSIQNEDIFQSTGMSDSSARTADQAGAILGIANV